MAKRHPIVHHGLHHGLPFGGGLGVYIIYDSIVNAASALTKDASTIKECIEIMQSLLQ